MKNSKSLVSMILSLAVMLSLFCMTTVVQTQAAGTTYYVDSTSGSDNNSGTSATSAWKSLTKVNATTFSPGSTILFKRGEKWDGVLAPKGSGNAVSYITVSSYGDEADSLPIISNASASQTANGINAALVLQNQNYWKIKNLELENSNGTTEKSVVYLSATNGVRSTNITVSDCVIHGSAGSWRDTSSSGKGLNGVTISHNNSYYGFHDNITIENNTVYDCNGDGILELGAWGGSGSDGQAQANSDKNIIIRGNYLTHIGRDGILVNNCNAPLVEYNVVEGSHSSTTSSYHVAIWPFSAHNALFQYNEAYNTKTTKDGQGLDCDYQCYGTTFQYNYAHNNEGGFMLICCEPQTWDGGQAWNSNITVRYNIAQNNGSNQISFLGQLENTKIYNNTLYYTTGKTISFGIRNASKVPNNTQFYNNIFYNVNGGEYQTTNSGASMKNTVWKNNLFYGRHPSNEPSGGNKITSDPMFINAGGAGVGLDTCQVYYLKEGSPALGAGVAVENISAYPCTTDFFGNPLSGTPNIGAYGGKGYNGTSVTTAKSTVRSTTKPQNTNSNTSSAVIDDVVCAWAKGGIWSSSGTSVSFDSGNMTVTTNASTKTNCVQIGAWDGACFTGYNMQNSVGKTGFMVRVKINSAQSDSGKPSKLDVALKLFVDGDKTAYILNAAGIPVGGGEVECYFPFADFKYHTDPSRAFDPASIANVTNLEFDVISSESFDDNKFHSLNANVSSIYAYHGDHTVKPTTAAPTTATPKTTAPTTQAPTAAAQNPTAQQPTMPTQAPTAATVAPTTAVATPTPTPAAAKPVKVKKLKVRTAGKKKVKVSWKKAKNAKKYIVKYSYKKSMKSAKTRTVKKLKVTLKKLKSGKRVYVRVQAVNGKVKGKFSVRRSVKVK